MPGIHNKPNSSAVKIPQDNQTVHSQPRDEKVEFQGSSVLPHARDRLTSQQARSDLPPSPEIQNRRIGYTSEEEDHSSMELDSSYEDKAFSDLSSVSSDDSSDNELETQNEWKKLSRQDSSFEDSSYLNLSNLVTADIHSMKSVIMETQQHIYDTYQDISNIFGIQPPPSSRQELYSKVLETINSGTPELKKEMSDQLINYAFEKKESLIADTESLIFLILSSLDNYENIETMFLDFCSERFRKIPSHREIFVNALIRRGEIDTAKHYLTQFCTDTLGINPFDKSQHLGKMFLIRAELAERTGHLDLAVSLYEKSFALDKNYLPAFRLLKIATSPSALQKLKQPEELVKKMAFLPAVTCASCLRDGVYRSKSPELIEATLVSAILAHRPIPEVQQLLNIAHQAALPVNQLIKQLKQVQAGYSLSGNMPLSHTPSRQSPDEYFKQLNVMLNHFSPALMDSSRTESIWEIGTFSYRGAMQSHKVAGNIRFGGQLYDHYVSRVDQGFFQRISEEKLRFFFTPDMLAEIAIKNQLSDYGLDLDATLNDIEDIHLFSHIVDSLIRHSFKTDELELENLQSEGHKIYDDRVTRLCKLFGLNRQTPDSLTNISTNMVMGIGDCRHHAQVKQSQ